MYFNIITMFETHNIQKLKFIKTKVKKKSYKSMMKTTAKQLYNILPMINKKV